MSSNGKSYVLNILTAIAVLVMMVIAISRPLQGSGELSQKVTANCDAITRLDTEKLDKELYNKLGIALDRRLENIENSLVRIEKALIEHQIDHWEYSFDKRSKTKTVGG